MVVTPNPPVYPTPSQGALGVLGGASPPVADSPPPLAENTYGQPTRVLSAERAWWRFNPGVVTVPDIPDAFTNQFIIDVELSKSDQAVLDPTWLTTAVLRVYRRNTTTGVTGLLSSSGTRYTLILEAGYEYFAAAQITNTTSADLGQSVPFPDGLAVVRVSPRPHVSGYIQEPDGSYTATGGGVQNRQQDFTWSQAFDGADPGADSEAAEMAWYSAVRGHVPGITWYNADYTVDPYIGPPTSPPPPIFDDDAGSVGGDVAGYVFHYEAGESEASFYSAHLRIDFDEDPATAGLLGDGTAENVATSAVFAAWSAAGAPLAMVAWDDEPPAVDRIQGAEVRAVSPVEATVDLGVEWYGMPMRDEPGDQYGAWGNDGDSGFAVGTDGGPADVIAASEVLFTHSSGSTIWKEFTPGGGSNGNRYVFHGFPVGWDSGTLPPGISGASSPDPLTEVMQHTHLGLERRYQMEAVPYRVVLNPVVVPVIPAYYLRNPVRLYPVDHGLGRYTVKSPRNFPRTKAERNFGGYR